MKNNALVSILTNLGLTEHEAQVYFASLSLGPATILAISRAAEMKRTTLYSVVQSLQNKGLMIIELRGFKRLFVAQEPEVLESLLRSRQEQLQKVLPQFSSLYNGKNTGNLRHYEGLNAVKSVYEGLLKTIRPHQEYMVIGDQTQWLQMDPEFFHRFIERRAKLPISIRLLLQDSPVAYDYKKIEKTLNERIKILPPKTKLTTNLVITPQKVVIHQLVSPIFAYVIENKSIINMHQEQFEILWNSIPEPGIPRPCISSQKDSSL